MEDDPTNTNKTSKQQAEFCLAAIMTIAAAAGVALPEATMKIYLKVLMPLSQERLTRAVNRTINDWRMAGLMPPVPFIIDRSYLNAYDEVVDDQPRITDTKRLLEMAREKVTHEQVEEWLAAGKQAQQEHIAELERDPKWQEMRARLSGKKPSLIPEDPEERKAWATRTAKKQGWR